MLKKYRKIIIFVLVIVLSFVLYTIFLKPDTDPELLKNSGPKNSDDAGEKIKEILSDIQSIKLNNAIFNNALYVRLRDDSRIIEEEPFRRGNPFEPIDESLLDGNISIILDIESEEGEQTLDQQSATSTDVENNNQQ